MAMSDSKATIRTVKRVQFGILSPDEIVSNCTIRRNSNSSGMTTVDNYIICAFQL